MKKGTLISIIIALVALAGALLGLVAYMRSRRCLECGNVEEDDMPDAGADYDMEYYVDNQGRPADVDDIEDDEPDYISTPVLEEDEEEDITE